MLQSPFARLPRMPMGSSFNLTKPVARRLALLLIAAALASGTNSVVALEVSGQAAPPASHSTSNVPTSLTTIPPEPGPNSVPVREHASELACTKQPVMALYRPELSRRPTREEREILLHNAQFMGDCIPVWKKECAVRHTGFNLGLENLCSIYASATEAFSRNVQAVALRKIDYGRYNVRSQEIENVRLSAEASIFKIAQEILDENQKAIDKRDAAAERREDVRRQEETIAVLRQLAAESVAQPRPVITNCNRSGDGAYVQCQSY
jgi:hypothetical protein